MDRGRRAEPYSNATIWTREIARNLAGHLSRVSKAHSCVDTNSPKSTRLPKFNHSQAQKRCPTSPMKTRQSLLAIPRNSRSTGESDLGFRGLNGGSSRVEAEEASKSKNNQSNTPVRLEDRNHNLTATTVITQLELQKNSANRAVEAIQFIQDQPVRVPAVKSLAKQPQRGISSGTLDDMVYNCPPPLPYQKNRFAHDYYKRQEQQKIWHENQALNKRLQSAKATLNSKEWKKDDKWTQDFLKTQEKRRSALQNEFRRAQMSPHALLRSKPLKSLNPKTPIHDLNADDDTCSPTNADFNGSAQSTRHKLKRRVLLENREFSSETGLLASAANHRRILKLRNQNPSPCSSGDLVNVVFTKDTDATDTGTEAPFIPDNEIINVRFTFSRGRSRGGDARTTHVDKSEVNERVRDQMSLSGAFSPGVELEFVLNAVAVDDSELIALSRAKQFSGDADDNTADTIGGEASSLHRKEQELNSEVLENVPDDTRADNNVFDKADVDATILPQETEERLSPPTPSDDSGEEFYDEDNFDDDPGVPMNKHHEQNGEASGYGSEFAEEAATFTIAYQAEDLTDNQDHGEHDDEDPSYSIDDFVEEQNQ